MMSRVNKPSRFPHSLVLIFAMVILAQLLTYVLPKGQFEMEPRPERGDPFVESTEQGVGPLRERLAAARAARGLDEQGLAEIFHVTEKTVQSWEAGPRGEDEAWRVGSQIEANVGALLDRWVRDGTEPTIEQIDQWKAAVNDNHPTVVGGTYKQVEGGDGLPWHAALTKLPHGLFKAKEIIFFVFVVGGVIGILRATGAIDALIGRAIGRLSHQPVLLIAGMTLLFAIGSSTIGMAEEYMPFVPLLVTLSLALKLDAIVALGIVYIGAGVGYGCAALNPFTVLVAQEVAGVEPTSGMLFRIVFMFAAATVGVLHIMRYARRIAADPSRSLVRDIDYSKGFEAPTDVALTPGRILVLLSFLAAIVLIVYGVGKYEWWFDMLMAVFLGLGILAAIFGRLSPNEAAKQFCDGAAEMTTTALLIGVARTIEVVLDDGMVIHTIIDGVATSISGAGSFVSSLGMLALQSIANLFIPSGSGQAYVTMPIMAPLSDICHVERQTAVLAYQIGDGFTNMIVPTNGLLMGMLALGRVPYGRWLKFILPLMLQLYALATVAMFFAWLLDYR